MARRALPPTSALGRRFLFVGIYWLVQAAVFFFGWPLLILGEAAGGNGAWSDMFHADYLWQAGVWIPCVMLLQAAFVLPVHRPTAEGKSWRARALISCIGGVAVAMVAGFMAWILTSIVAMALNSWSTLQVDDNATHIWHLGFWIPFGVVALVAIPLLLRRTKDGMPLGVSATIAGFISGAMVLAFIGGVASLIGSDLDFDRWVWAVIGLVIVASWCVSTPLLLAFLRRGSRESTLSRLASVLFIGTVVEAAAIIPLDVMVRRRTSCYCGEGTFYSLTALWSVGLLILGPAVYLLPFGRRRRRLDRQCCVVCGYDMKGRGDQERCPECGAGWRGEAEASPTNSPGRTS